MRGRKAILCILLCCALSLQACGAIDSQKQNGQTETNCEVADEKEEPERLNTTHFDNLPKVVEQVGFSFRAVESFGEDWHFSNFSVYEQQDTDYKNEPVGKPYTAVGLRYRLGKSVFTYDVMIHKVGGDDEYRPTAVSSEEINGVEVFFTEYTLKMVTGDYELTEEDYERIAQGNYSVSNDGETNGYVSFRGAYWIEDGIFYRLLGGLEDMPMDDVKEIVTDLLENAQQQ